MHAIHLKFFYKNIIIHLKAILKVDKYEKVIFYRSPALFALFQVMHSVMILKFFFFYKDFRFRSPCYNISDREGPGHYRVLLYIYYDNQNYRFYSPFGKISGRKGGGQYHSLNDLFTLEWNFVKSKWYIWDSSTGLCMGYGTPVTIKACCLLVMISWRCISKK